MQYAMINVHSAGGTGASTATGDNIPWIVKTGTSDNQENNWVMGATTKTATVVWIGNVSGHTNVTRARFSGGAPWNLKQAIWRDIMRVANPVYGGGAFTAPTADMIAGKKTVVPAVEGLTKDQAKTLIESVGLRFKDGGPIDSELPMDVVVKADPKSGDPASTGGEVTVYTSNHVLVAGPPNVVGMTVAQATTAFQAAGFNILVTTSTATPTPCPSPNQATPCPQPSSTLTGDQRIILTQSSTGGFLKPGAIITVTVQG